METKDLSCNENSTKNNHTLLPKSLGFNCWNVGLREKPHFLTYRVTQKDVYP